MWLCKTRSVNSECKKATKKDCIVLWCGANDVSKNNTKEGLQHVDGFVKEHECTNIIIMSFPYRHDLCPLLCISTQVLNFNRKMKKMLM